MLLPIADTSDARVESNAGNGSLLLREASQLLNEGHSEEAESKLRAAVNAGLVDIADYRALGEALTRLERFDQAAKCFARIVEREPDAPANWSQWAQSLRKASKVEEALAAIDKAISLSPDEAEFHFERGVTSGELKRQKDARQSYQRALELKSDHVQSLNNLGVLSQEAGEVDEAIRLLEEAVRLRPQNSGGHNNLGVAYADKGQFERAIECYQNAIALSANHTIAWNNLGNALRAVGRDQEAIAVLQNALRQRPDYAEAYNNLAITQVQLGRHEQAIASYNRAIFLRPEYAESRMNRGLEFLALGDFERGWPDYEWRWQTRTLRIRKFRGPRWDGSHLAGKRILLCYEQGLGDTLQFIRYAADLKQRGATVIFEGQPVLRQMLSRTPGIDEYVSRGQQKVPPFDFHCPLLSLPGIFQSSLHSIPARVPYIHPDPEVVQRWKPRMDALGGFRVGIAWQGNPQHKGDRRRSARLLDFEPLARVEGVRLVSLQRGFGAEQIDQLKSHFELITLNGIDEEGDGFLRTAAIMHNVDLLITIDTAVAHLAGAMGLPAWVLIPPACDWRWLQGREDSPWYPTIRLFRQSKSADWTELFSRVAEALQAHVVQRRTREIRTIAAKEDTIQAEELVREGIRLLKAEDLPAARAKLEQAVGLSPFNSRIHHDLGVVYGRLGQAAIAIGSFRRAIELAPSAPNAYGNIGLAFYQNGQIDEAASHLRTAIRLGGGTAEVYNNLGTALCSIPDLPGAEASYLAALRLRPEYAQAHYNLSRVLLGQGKFEQGWIEYEWRWKSLHRKPRDFASSCWTGNGLDGRTILLYAEQGLGDTLQFVRFAAIAKQQRGNVIVECQPELVKLLERCPFIDRVVRRAAKPPKHDTHGALMSLPGTLGVNSVDDIRRVANIAPYLFPDPGDTEKWKRRLASLQGLRVGIAWQGNPKHMGDKRRSAALRDLEPLSRIPGVTLISLQRGFGIEQLDKGGGFEVVRFDGVDEQSDAFLRTAAIMANLDLVVTIDTAIAHLAGAMGVPAWVALAKAPDWRWLEEGETTPWYQSLRLFRQGRSGEWAEVFERIANELRGYGSSLERRRNGTSIAAIDPEPLHQQGRRHLERGNLQEAAEYLRQAIELRPDFALAHHDMGVVEARQRHFTQAIAYFRRALELDPQLHMVYGNLTLALIENHDYHGAVDEAQRAITIMPRSADLHYRLGLALNKLARYSEAAPVLRRAIDLRPSYAQAHLALGVAYRETSNVDEAIGALRKAMELHPRLGEAHLQLGQLLLRANCHHEAVIHLREAVGLRPADPHALFEVGVCEAELGRFEQAADAFQRSIYLRPKHPATHVALGHALIAQGMLGRAWSELDWRWRDGSQPCRRQFPGKRWDGSAVAGQTILLTANGELGETIQFLRYSRELTARGAKVFVEIPYELRGLVRDEGTMGQIIVAGQALPESDWYAFLSSLPGLFRTTLKTIPASAPCLKAPADRMAFWSQQIPSDASDLFRIGIAWRSDSPSLADSKFIQWDSIQPLAKLPRVKLVSLQRNVTPAEVSAAGLDVVPLPELVTSSDFLSDAASVMTHLDLIVTADLLLASVAGGMGIPTVVLLDLPYNWHWLPLREVSPWFPSVRVIARQLSEDWGAVMNHVAQLAGRVST